MLAMDKIKNKITLKKIALNVQFAVFTFFTSEICFQKCISKDEKCTSFKTFIRILCFIL